MGRQFELGRMLALVVANTMVWVFLGVDMVLAFLVAVVSNTLVEVIHIAYRMIKNK